MTTILVVLIGIKRMKMEQLSMIRCLHQILWDSWNESKVIRWGETHIQLLFLYWLSSLNMLDQEEWS